MIAPILIAAGMARGQAVPRVDTGAALKQVVKRVEPVMPPIAAMAKVTGKVIADVTIGVTGSVESTAIIEGSALFTQAAEIALKQWTFKPFLVNGRAARVVVLIELQFGTPMEDTERRVRDSYWTTERECERQKELRAPAADTVCAELVRIARQLPEDEYLMLSRAYELHGGALIVLGRTSDALKELEHALDVGRKHLRPDQAEYAEVYAEVAIVNDLLGRDAAADEHYAIALASYDRAVASLPSMRSTYARNQLLILERYAALKRRMKQPDEAAMLDAKRAALSREPDRTEPTIATISGVVCVGIGCALVTPALLAEVLEIVPSGSRAWMVTLPESLTDPNANAWIYLEPTVTSGPLLRGPMGLITRPFGEPGQPRPTTGWRYGPIAGSWVQVIGPGANPRSFSSPDDVNLPIEIHDASNADSLGDDDVVAIVNTVREAGAATARARYPSPRVFNDVQPWRIRSLGYIGAAKGEIVAMLSGIGAGEFQRVHLKKADGRWTVTSVER